MARYTAPPVSRKELEYTVGCWRDDTRFPTGAEVAKHLGISLDAVYKRLRSAKAAVPPIPCYGRADRSAAAKAWFLNDMNDVGGAPFSPVEG